MNRRSQAGFTLMELMVVIAIVGILSLVMFGMATRPYEANAQTVSERLVSAFGLARERAVATRKVHKVTLYYAGTEQVVSIQAAPATGMAYSGTTAWEWVEAVRIPKTALIQNVSAGAITSTGANPSLNSALSYSIYFKPDGSATSSTVYVSDHNGTPHYYRVLVYHATGVSYARQNW